MQQKIQAELQMKKEEHLTVYKKSSLDGTLGTESVAAELESTMESVNMSTMKKKAHKMKSVVSLLRIHGWKMNHVPITILAFLWGFFEIAERR